jgi:hypothetical protein
MGRMAAATSRLIKLMAQHKVLTSQLDQEPDSKDRDLEVCVVHICRLLRAIVTGTSDAWGGPSAVKHFFAISSFNDTITSKLHATGASAQQVLLACARSATSPIDAHSGPLEARSRLQATVTLT